MIKIETKILIVDDSPSHISLIGGILDSDYDILVANNGQQALDLVGLEKPDMILLDITMPEMDGFEVCRRLKQDEATQEIPVVFTTARSGSNDITKGLEMGASYYLTKPIDIKVLRAVVRAVLNDQSAYKRLREDINRANDMLLVFLEEGRFLFRTLEEAHTLSVLLAKACPDPNRNVLGLRELMVNAVEHGNLGISYDEKSTLHVNNQWIDEVQRRLALPEYQDKYVTVTYERTTQEIRFLIADQGKGFDWKPYLTIDPSRVFDSHGRGIAMAGKISFDRIEYRNRGNEVLAVIRF